MSRLKTYKHLMSTNIFKVADKVKQQRKGNVDRKRSKRA